MDTLSTLKFDARCKVHECILRMIDQASELMAFGVDFWSFPNWFGS